LSIDSLEIAAVSLSHYRSLAFNVVLFFFRELLLFLFMQFSRYTLVGSSGLEPPTSRLSGARSNHLSYEPIVVEMNGFEPMASCLQGRRSPN
jgi:hypothetical protein